MHQPGKEKLEIGQEGDSIIVQETNQEGEENGRMDHSLGGTRVLMGNL